MLTSENIKCVPLVEACTLDLYKKNIFRITGLPVDATPKEVSRQVQKMQMLEEMGGGSVGPQTAFASAESHTGEEIRDALSRMKEPEHRIVDEFFWFWPEEFGKSKDDLAIQAMLAGDDAGAYQLWKDREKSGSHVAQHNMAILHHMFAVDWTNHHFTADLDEGRDEKIKKHWRQSFERWEAMIDADDTWDMLKERIRSLDDEALTTGFARRMLRQLPEALDRVNAEAALKLAEQGRIDWAKFHVDFMRETHAGLDDVDSTSEMVLAPTKKRVEQHLESFQNDVKLAPERGAELALELLDHCRPMMNIFDLFHGEDAHQRNDLFDKVAEAVLEMVVAHQRSTGDNKTFVDLLQRALKFASGGHIRERLIKNIAIGEGNLKGALREKTLKEFFELFKSIRDIDAYPKVKYALITEKIMLKLPQVSAELGIHSELSRNLSDSVAMMLREVSVEAHNSYNDNATALKAIQLARKLVKSEELMARINSDFLQLSQNMVNTMPSTAFPTARHAAKQSSSGCLFLLLLPSFLGASAIYAIMNQIT